MDIGKFFRGRIAGVCLLLALGALSSGCATTGLQTLSNQAVLLDLPLVRQNSPNLCGLAAVEMLTRYYNVRLTEEQSDSLKKEAARNKGITGKVLKRVLTEQGYFTAVFSGTLDRKVSGLYRHLDLRRPLIVMVEGDGRDKNHYVLAVGYDEGTNAIVLLDPVRGGIAMPLVNFRKVWGKVDNFTLLAVPKGLKSE